jgi:transcriptional regulator with XRE-family HTH domain
MQKKRLEILFGEVVRGHRKEMGLSQEAFAAKAGIHRTYMSLIERGKVQVSIGMAQQVAETLEIPLSRLWKEIEAELARKRQ